MRERVWLLGRLAISAGLLAWIVSRIDLASAAGALRNANVLWALIANVLTAAVLLLVSWKWGILLAAAGSRQPFWRLVRMNLVGSFYGLVLPGEETGALAKGLILSRGSPEGSAVAASIAIDETLGSVALFSVALVGLALTRPFPLRVPVAAAMGALWLVFVLLLVMALVPAVHFFAWRFIAGVLEWAKLGKVRGWLQPFADRLRWYHRRPGPIAAAFLITVAASLVANLSALATFRAAGVTLSFLDASWIVAAISALVTIPVSVAGVGVREGANVAILGQLRVSSSRALAVSLLSFLFGLVWSLPGGALQFRLPKRRP